MDMSMKSLMLKLVSKDHFPLPGAIEIITKLLCEYTHNKWFSISENVEDKSNIQQ